MAVIEERRKSPLPPRILYRPPERDELLLPEVAGSKVDGEDIQLS
jgi:hypothetical protein